MRTIFAVAMAAGLSIAAPAFAQDAGSPGAVGTGGSLTGSNPPGGAATRMKDGDATDRTTPMVEERASAPEGATPSNPAPETVRGDQNGQNMAK